MPKNPIEKDAILDKGMGERFTNLSEEQVQKAAEWLETYSETNITKDEILTAYRKYRDQGLDAHTTLESALIDLMRDAFVIEDGEMYARKIEYHGNYIEHVRDSFALVYIYETEDKYNSGQFILIIASPLSSTKYYIGLFHYGLYADTDIQSELDRTLYLPEEGYANIEEAVKVGLTYLAKGMVQYAIRNAVGYPRKKLNPFSLDDDEWT